MSALIISIYMLYLLFRKNTDKYKFYCSVTNSYMNANNNICDFSCNNIGYVTLESTETSYSKYYIPVPIICEPK